MISSDAGSARVRMGAARALTKAIEQSAKMEDVKSIEMGRDRDGNACAEVYIYIQLKAVVATYIVSGETTITPRSETGYPLQIIRLCK